MGPPTRCFFTTGAGLLHGQHTVAALQHFWGRIQRWVAHPDDQVEPGLLRVLNGLVQAVIDRLEARHLRPLGTDQGTSNQLEAFNTLMKHLQEWKEVPVDSTTLWLYRLIQYYIWKVRRTHHGIGEFMLRPGALIVNNHLKLLLIFVLSVLWAKWQIKP